MTSRPSKKRKLSDHSDVGSLDDDHRDDRQNDIIKLDVGGVHFVTFRSTLLSVKDSYFSKRFGGKFDDGPKLDGRYFIDRNGEHFGVILEYLRNGENVVLSQFKDDATELSKLLLETEYYCLPQLTELVEEEWPNDCRLSKNQKLTMHLCTRIGRLSQVLNETLKEQGLGYYVNFEQDSEIEFREGDYDW